MLNTPLLQQNLTTQIKQLLDTSFDENSNPEQLKMQFAQNLSEIIATSLDSWIRQATITVSPGIAVATSGSPVAQTGVTTSTGTGTLS